MGIAGKTLLVIVYYATIALPGWLAVELALEDGEPRSYGLAFLAVFACAVLPMRRGLRNIGGKCLGGFLGSLAGVFAYILLFIISLHVGDAEELQPMARLFAAYFALGGAAAGVFAARLWLTEKALHTPSLARSVHGHPRVWIFLDLCMLAIAAMLVINL